jgi:hypothetical protein
VVVLIELSSKGEELLKKAARSDFKIEIQIRPTGKTQIPQKWIRRDCWTELLETKNWISTKT